WMVYRTGYTVDDLVVAMRSGPPFNHEHGDRNSLIYKHWGEVLLTDHKHPTYDARRPDWLLRTAPAHNTVLIDGQGHQYHHGEEGTNESKAAAHIVRKAQRNRVVYWASDAAPAYTLVNPDVQSVTRSVLVFQEIPLIIVLDKLKKKQKASTFAARWHVENSDNAGECQVNANSFTILRPFANFYGVCAGSPAINLTCEKLSLPDSVGVFPFVNSVTQKAETEAFIIMAGTSFQSGQEHPLITIEMFDGHWLVSVQSSEKGLKVKIWDQGDLPEFEIADGRF
ncbi:heparinase II/III family protein, partial [candidate division KSB1 bacterium]|nr:heparinase II/III family protein [candidate division KSB1 bacterium]